MLIVPVLYGTAFWGILKLPSSVHKIDIFDPRTYIIHSNYAPEESQPAIENENYTPAVSAISGADVLESEGDDEFPHERVPQRNLTFTEKIKLFGVRKFFEIQNLPASSSLVGNQRCAGVRNPVWKTGTRDTKDFSSVQPGIRDFASTSKLQNFCPSVSIN